VWGREEEAAVKAALAVKVSVGGSVHLHQAHLHQAHLLEPLDHHHSTPDHKVHQAPLEVLADLPSVLGALR